MKAQWKDYKYGSWLVLVFGKVDAKIVQLTPADMAHTDALNRWGVLMHPVNTFEIVGTLDDAKRETEKRMNNILSLALLSLKGEPPK